MSKKIIRGFRTNMALYGLCLIVFVIVTIPFEPLLALAGLYVIFAAGYIALDRFATLEATGHLDQV